MRDDGYSDPSDKPAALRRAAENLDTLKGIRKSLRGAREEEAKAVQQWKKVLCVCPFSLCMPLSMLSLSLSPPSKIISSLFFRRD